MLSTLVPTLRVGTGESTLRVEFNGGMGGGSAFATRSVQQNVPTQSVGTRTSAGTRKNLWWAMTLM